MNVSKTNIWWLKGSTITLPTSETYQSGELFLSMKNMHHFDVELHLVNTLKAKWKAQEKGKKP